MTWFRSPPGRAVLAILALYAVMIAIVMTLRLTEYRLIAPARIGIGLAVAVPAFYFLIRYWKSLDEAAKEAQKWACFWGGTLGSALGFVLTAVKPLGWASLFEGADPTHLMAYGGLTVMVGQIAGFYLAWTYWWMSRR